MMNQSPANKIESLRELMKARRLDACIIPSSDPHISEYPAGHWKSREWFSGFNGSAGTLVVTMDKAGLWTDYRYFLQAEKQLESTGINLYKEKTPGIPNISEWLEHELQEGSAIGIDGKVYAASEALSLIRFFQDKKITIHTQFDPSEVLWIDRPPIPENKLFVFPEYFSGISPKEKIRQVRDAITEAGCDMTILGSLDTIAWLLNIRGNDIQYNPVVISYAIVSEKETILFINPGKLTKEAIEHLSQENVILADYEKITGYIRQIPPGKKLLLNPSRLNYSLFNVIPESCPIVKTDIHPADLLKSLKNETEIAGIRRAMEKDGVALVRFFMWLEKSLDEKTKVTELDVSEKLREFRSEQEYYFGESFNTIAGYGPHGAIIHYSATEESNSEIKPEGLLLIDSGAQYFDGTTDITRTIAPGEVSDAMKKDYTLVLKGYIGLDSARFPQGTKGIQLDILARKPLWENGINYLYGTGHGIGHFLNVHEGPQSIRMDYNPVSIQENMITSNEPGIYRKNAYGIRTENLILTVKDQKTEAGQFYRFETLTLCPIDKKPVDKSLLTEEETHWLNNYHKKVWERLSPFLNEEEKCWLKNKTNEL